MDIGNSLLDIGRSKNRLINGKEKKEDSMKKGFLTMLLLFPLVCFGVENLRINGQTELTVHDLPITVQITYDVAAAGNQTEVIFYADINQSGTADANDRQTATGKWCYITDGIGWIIDPDNPEASIYGDETGTDGHVTLTFEVPRYMGIAFPKGKAFIDVKDEDGSTAHISANMDLALTPPMITGTVMGSGQPAPNSLVIAVPVGEAIMDAAFMTTSDANGNYSVMVNPGLYNIIANPGPDFNNHMTSDSVRVTVGEGAIANQNFDLQLCPATLEGTVLFEDGGPLANVEINAMDFETWKTSRAVTNAQGQFSMGIVEGQSSVWINGNGLYGVSWPSNRYSVPPSGNVNAAAGETLQLDFTAYEFSAYIEGDCTIEGEPLENLEVGAEFTSPEGTVEWTDATTDENGHYQLGVEPGELNDLAPPFYNTDYAVTSPADGKYSGIQIQDGDILTGYDFTLVRAVVTAPVGGKLIYADGSAAADVYVAAVNSWPVRKNLFYITYTDENGNYLFPELGWGEWQIGVYQEGATATPAMHYYNLGTGDEVTDADFTLDQFSPDPLTRIVISPANTNLNVGETQEFTVNGYDRADNELTITPIWTATGGTLTPRSADADSAAVIYTAQETGNHIVVCTDSASGIADTAYVSVTTTGIVSIGGFPEKFELSQNFPNPFNPVTTIRYNVKEPCRVVLKIFNLHGQEVVTLVDGVRAAGSYQTTFQSGTLSSGIYFYQIKMKDFVKAKKMMLME